MVHCHELIVMASAGEADMLRKVMPQADFPIRTTWQGLHGLRAHEVAVTWTALRDRAARGGCRGRDGTARTFVSNEVIPCLAPGKDYLERIHVVGR